MWSCAESGMNSRLRLASGVQGAFVPTPAWLTHPIEYLAPATAVRQTRQVSRQKTRDSVPIRNLRTVDDILGQLGPSWVSMESDNLQQVDLDRLTVRT